MPRFICLLRGINVSGHRKMRMADLRALLSNLGYTDIETYLQSGNAVFSAKGSGKKIAARIEQAITETFDQIVGALVLNSREFLRMATSNPLVSKPSLDPKFLHVTFLLDDAKREIPRDTFPFSGDEQAIHARGHYYLYCPNGYGRTRINNSWFERQLKIRTTTRNWKTVTALVCMLEATTNPR